MELDLFNQPPFFNTTNEVGDTLKEYTNKATVQCQKVLDFMRRAHQATPSEVHRFLHDGLTPLTSIRRAMTVLTKEGLLLKTKEMQVGPFNRREHVWEYVETPIHAH